MNKVFKVIWSEVQQAWVVASELGKARGKSKSRTAAPAHTKIGAAILAAGLTVLAPPSVQADGYWGGATDSWFTVGNWEDSSGNPLGALPSGSDDVYIDNAGTALINSGGTANAALLRLGTGSGLSGSVAISNNTELTSDFSDIGEASGGEGSVSVGGSGSTWTNNAILAIGDAGTGTLSITNSGIVSVSGTMYLGKSTGGTGTVSVDSGYLTAGSQLNIGDAGTGTLSITNSGTVSSSSVIYVGKQTGGVGTVSVDGSGSTMTAGDRLVIGNYGTGTLSITNLATVSASNRIYLGRLAGAKGTVTVDGGATLEGTTSSANLYVGDYGTGELNITDGGKVNLSNAATVYLGSQAGGSGTLTVDGTNSELTGGIMSVGTNGGTGIFTIRNGGTATSSFVSYVGASSGTGTATVDGRGSNWDIAADLFVGHDDGHGELTISNGATVSSGGAEIAASNAAVGTVTVDGTGSTWNTSSLNIGGGSGGDGATGTLNIRNGAEVNIDSGSGDLYIADDSGSTGTGTLNIGAAAGETVVAAGTLNAAKVYLGGGGLNDGTGKIVFNHTDTDYIFSADISNTNGSTIELLSGTTRFTGDLRGMLSGTMIVDGGTLSIVDGETLTLGNDYTQTANGILKVGASSNSSFGKLDVYGLASFEAGSKIDVDVSNANTLAIGETLSGVVTAGSLDATTFSLSDNSTLFNFEAVINGNTVDLNIIEAANVLDSVNSTNFGAGLGAAQVLDSFIDAGTTGTDIDDVVTALGQLEGDEAISQAVADTLPILVAGLDAIAIGNLHATSRIVQARQDNSNGLSSGDFILTDKYIWVKPVGNWAEQDQRNGVSGYKADSYGLVGGIDGDINDTTKLGFAVSYMNTDVKGKDSASGNTADIDAYQAIVYGSHALTEHMELNWQADAGINKNEGNRYISFMNRTANADYNSYTAHVGAGIGKSFSPNDNTTVVPSIRADYAYIKDESYSETGAGALNLNVDSSTSDELILTAQSSVSHELNDKATLVANAGIGYDLINDQTSLTASYSGGGTAFTTTGIDPSPWIGSAGAGINYQVSDTSEITARYDVEGRSDFLSQTASVKFRWMF